MRGFVDDVTADDFGNHGAGYDGIEQVKAHGHPGNLEREKRSLARVLVSQIGRPVDDPHVVDIVLATEDGPFSNALRTAVADIARSQLGQMRVLRDELLSERLTLY